MRFSVRSYKAAALLADLYATLADGGKDLPAQEDEQLVELWLWSGQEGVFSHRTALVLYDLSDALPLQVEMTVPAAWRRRRLRVPEVLRLHYADVPEQERGWVGHVPVTTPARTLRDCMAASVAPDLVRQAVEEGIARGRFSEEDVAEVVAWLDHFAGSQSAKLGSACTLG